MPGQIKVLDARNNYAAYATGAIRAERNAQYAKAAELWDEALSHARTTAYRRWAELRAAFCANAATRGWGVPDGRH